MMTNWKKQALCLAALLMPLCAALADEHDSTWVKTMDEGTWVKTTERQNVGEGAWIRMNQIGYLPKSRKVAVYITNRVTPQQVVKFTVTNAKGRVVYKSKTANIKATGSDGRLSATARLDMSALKKEGRYVMHVKLTDGSEVLSDTFRISSHAYDGLADYVLNYMRQQRCGWNPYTGDSCHTKDGYIEYHPTKSGQHIDVRGGWHDASDCLQYTTTTANAIYQMMYAYQSNPEAFGDEYKADGTKGQNGIPDIVDEIYWGMDWLDRMNPAPGEFYNQLGDDRDHMGMRRPHDDKANYGWGPGNGRPVYFVSGEPQQRGHGMNSTVGAASTAGKFAADFALGSTLLAPFYPDFAARIGQKAEDAFLLGEKKPGNCQTASVLSPYIYEEDNWTDDMELGALEMYHMTGNTAYLLEAADYGKREPTTPWMGSDTARHYQWYPFMNMGHCLLAKEGNESQKTLFTDYVREGIRKTAERGASSPWLNGVPSVWCSNNLTTAMLTQCILYRQITGDTTYEEMESALRDWLLGCNPWGVCMIVDLPGAKRTPTQPHSYIYNLGLGSTYGGLVDGPVYRTIFESLKGVNMTGGVNYLDLQPAKMVYHDCTHDYSTNEPTMDGTASLTFPLSAYEKEGEMQRGGCKKNKKK